MVIDGVPVSVHKGAYKQQERALRLMEIGYKRIDDAETESGNDYDASADLKLL